MERMLALVFALFVLLNEFVLGFSSTIGISMYLVLMSVSLLFLSRKDELDDVSKMAIVFLSVPLIRIASLFLDISYVWKVGLGHGILLFLGIYYLYKFNIDIGETYEYLWMAPLVFCVGALVGIFSNIGFGSGGSLVLIMVLPLVAFSEEIFFRGLMQNTLEKSCGIFYSLIIPGVIYMALSFYLGIGLMILFLFVGLFSGFLYLSTKNIFLSIIFNLVVSAFIFIIPNLV